MQNQQDEQGLHTQESVNLLNTDVLAEYKGPPLNQRIKKFVAKNYSLESMVPSTKWIPAYFGSGEGGWRENLYGDIFAGCTTAAFLVPQVSIFASLLLHPRQQRGQARTSSNFISHPHQGLT